MILLNYMKKWDASSALSKSVTAAIISLCVLLIVSCGGPKAISRETREQQIDSVTERITTTVKPVIVPRTQADLRLKVKEVENLTPGAIFTQKNGQASVRVERRDSLIYITATCDSLQVLAESQYREIYHLRQQLSTQETLREKTPGFWEQAKTAAFHAAVGMVLMFLITLKKRVL